MSSKSIFAHFWKFNEISMETEIAVLNIVVQFNHKYNIFVEK